MQNEKEGKTVEQIAAELNPYRKDAHSYDPWEKGFETGHTTAQQSQPMWREIEGDKLYSGILVQSEDVLLFRTGAGDYLIGRGYTHYLSSEDLLKLPVEKK